MWRAFNVESVVRSLVTERQVIAGGGGLERLVSKARLATSANHLDRAEVGEIIVTSFEAIGEPPGAATTLSRLHRREVAAVAVHHPTDDPVPSEMVAAADELDLPIIAFTTMTEASEVMSAVVDGLLLAQGQRLDRVLDIHQRFTPIVLAGGGAGEVASTLYSLVDHPVAILDAAGRTTVVVPAGAARDVDLASRSHTRHPISAGDHVYGEIVVLLPEGDLDEDGRLALERASFAVAVRLAHSAVAAAEQERFASTSLEELIAGTTGNIDDVIERASSFGWDLARPRAVLLASIDPWTDPEHLATSLNTIAFAARATLGPRAIVWTRSTSVAALIAPDTAGSSERRLVAERLQAQLDQRLTLVTVSIGVGRCVDHPVQLPGSYVEAYRAVEVGRWAKGRHVTEVYDELGLERLLASTPADDLAEFVEQAIGDLIDHDRNHNSDLVETLGMWLETHNMAEAARRLHVHYNTFKNRLDRIETIAGPVLTDSAKALECSVAIYVYRHYEGPWSPVVN